MRKFIFMMLMLIVAFAFTSCESCDNKDNSNVDFQGITWNLDVCAMGQGELNVYYPTGNLILTGDATLKANTTNDTVEVLMNGECPEYKQVLAAPNQYSPEQVQLANEIKSAIGIDTMVGKWQVDITGYAKYANIYLVIDEHWPTVPNDSTVGECVEGAQGMKLEGD